MPLLEAFGRASQDKYMYGRFPRLKFDSRSNFSAAYPELFA